jgi:hypothetical protein
VYSQKKVAGGSVRMFTWCAKLHLKSTRELSGPIGKNCREKIVFTVVFLLPIKTTQQLIKVSRYENRTILVDRPAYRGRYRSRSIDRFSDMGTAVMIMCFVVCFVLTSILCEVMR